MADLLPSEVEIAIAGGSIGGLCAGNALLAAGHDVHVFERSARRLTSQGAGIVVQSDLLQLMSISNAPPLAMTQCTTRQTVNAATGAVHKTYMPQQFTSWEAIYTSLSAIFPKERYHSDSAVTVEASTRDGVTLTSGYHHLKADLLVAADGLRSATRACFAPDTVSQYAGYIAWRGVVEEADLPDDLVAFFEDNFSFCNLGDGGHALCYLIPGESGATARGTRRLNWVWYVTVPAGSALEEIMTDNEGRLRDAAVGPGQVSADALRKLHTLAADLNPHFADLVRATPQPFIQSILDVAPPRMVYDRVCLIGDAAFVVRPHTAGATAKAASDATALASALQASAPDIDRGLKAWNQQQVAIGRRLVDYGVILGERSAKRRTA